MNKLFIIGLPRTGTTSISAALLEHGFQVAHTAFTKRAFELADVISDAPCFSDYPQLDQLFPDSKFVYLDRAMENWVPSMQMLLTKMNTKLDPEHGSFHPVLKRSFNTTFGLQTTDSPLNSDHLTHCYQTHQQAVHQYFTDRDDLLTLDISQPDSFNRLLNFIDIDTSDAHSTAAHPKEFPKLNTGTRVSGWNSLKHPNKVNSYSAGKEHRKFFDYI